MGDPRKPFLRKGSDVPDLVMRPLLNADELATWARAQGFRDLVPSAWHVTVINGRSGLDRQAIDLQMHALHLPASPSRYLTRMCDFIVLVIESVELRRRNATLRLTAPERDFFPYTPHVTFSTNRRRHLGGVAPFAGPLVFGPEVMQPGEKADVRWRGAQNSCFRCCG